MTSERNPIKSSSIYSADEGYSLVKAVKWSGEDRDVRVFRMERYFERQESAPLSDEDVTQCNPAVGDDRERNSTLDQRI
jgi:hypothetical protein